MQPCAAGPGFDLLLITDPTAPQGLVGSVRAALAELTPSEAKRVAVQLRAKEATADERLEVARELRALTSQYGVKLLINGDLVAAKSSAADGVHLPEQGPTPIEARATLGEAAIIGVSCHAPDGLQRAAKAGATYATLSPVFESPGKGEPLGLEQFAEWVRRANLPVFALGGIKAAQAPALKKAGASGIAVIGAVFRSADPACALQKLLEAWN